MMIGLPNQDKSFTMTLFMPKVVFDGITNGVDLIKFFEEHFADSIPLIGKDKLVEDYFNTKPLPLISIKCSPYNVSDKCLILGDAAHAMVPFYGQGMNCVSIVMVSSASADIRSKSKPFQNISNCRTTFWSHM